MFRQAKQETSQSIDTFHNRLRKLAEICEFVNVNNEIKSPIIHSCNSSRLRRRALRESDIDLKQLLLLARSFEIRNAQASKKENEDAALIHAGKKPLKPNAAFAQKRYQKRKRPKYSERNISK